RKPFEIVPDVAQGDPPRYRLRSVVPANNAIASFGLNPADVTAAKSILKYRALELLKRRHADMALAAKASAAAKASPEKTRALLDLVMPTQPDQRAAIADALHGGPIERLEEVVDRLIRYSVLFRAAAFDDKALDFVRRALGVFDLSPQPSLNTLYLVSRYAALATPPDPAYQPDAPTIDRDALHAVLAWTGSIKIPADKNPADDEALGQ